MVRGAFLRVAGYVAGTGLSLVSAIVLTRHLGVTRFGQYTTIIAVATVATQLTEGGLTSLTTREYASASGSTAASQLQELLGLQLFSGLAAMVIATGFAVAAGYDGQRIAATALAAFGLAILLLQNTLAVPLATSLRLGTVSAIELLRLVTFVGLTLLLVLAGAGLLPLVAALVPASLLALWVTARLTRRLVALRPLVRPRAWAGLFRAAIVLTLATALWSLYGVIAQVLTSLVATPHQTGLFAVAFRVFGVIVGAAFLVATAGYPLLARTALDDRERMAFVIQRMFAAMLMLGFASLVLAVTGADAIVTVIAGPKYRAAAPALQIEGVALLGSWIAMAGSFAVVSLRQHRALLLANLAALVVTSVLTLTLAASHGARGAAIGSAAGEWTLAAAFLFALVRTDSRLHPAVGSLLRLMLAAGAACAVMALGLPSGWQLVLALAVYAIVGTLLRAFPRELLELVSNLLLHGSAATKRPS